MHSLLFLFYENPLVLLSLAVAPGLALTLVFYFADKYEKESKTLLASLFFSGMISIIPAVSLSYFFEMIGFRNDDSFWGVAFYSFLTIAFSEEISKFYFFWKVTAEEEEFNEPYDGILYSVMVSLGFATLENILYVFEHGFSVGVLRMFTAVPAHATFGVLMGFFAGYTKFTKDSSKIPFLVAGILCAIAFHGAYDFFLIKQNVPFLFVGAVFSLVTAIYFSFKAVRIHQQLSPFK